MKHLSRRTFVQLMGMGAGSAFVSVGVSGCSDDDNDTTPAPGGGSEPPVNVTFDHGVASGDPLDDRVILWTRVTPEEDGSLEVQWQVATDEAFANIVVQDQGRTTADRDYTVKVDAQGLEAGTTYYYRFRVGEQSSPIGKTKTLPTGSVSQAKFVVFSCSNYPAGFFHAYREAAGVADVDAGIHLGDYIYEYEVDGYASQDATALGRESVPTTELFSLPDYRARYAQYRSDADLQALHGALPFITVWDDHEVANDAYDGGAENHEADEGSWPDRLTAALQAYAEWMPIRPPVDEDVSSLQRSFQYGDLVRLIMLDTRIVGRDEQLSLADSVGPGAGDFAAALANPDRTLLGADQRQWLLGELQETATWHVLGQQVLMGTMELPAAVLPTDPSDPASAPLTVQEYGELAALFLRFQAAPGSLTPEEQQRLLDNQALLELPNLPYNLDAWDGYPVERATILAASAQAGNNLVVLAGDTHNAWANNLQFDGGAVGVEFATPSVSSPGLEALLGVTSAPDPSAAAAELEGGVSLLIDGLQYTNLLDRGFMTVTFTPTQVASEWTFVSSIKEQSYQVIDGRSRTITVNAGQNRII